MSGPESENENSWKVSFVLLWHEVWKSASTGGTSIDAIVMHLLDKEMIDTGDDAVNSCQAKTLVFTILGWQTMLFRAEIGSCIPTQLGIADETNGHRVSAHMCLRQSQSATTKHLHEFLLGFGLLLPCRNFSAMSSEDDKATLRELKSVCSSSFNACLLAKIGRININWTDSLACHLELDPSTDTLYLYRYPSFCAANLVLSEEKKTTRTIHTFASPPNAGSYWATFDEVNDLLQETLLSYRLLFGQKKSARRYFRELRPFEGLPSDLQDKSLMTICGKKRPHLSYSVNEREVYDLSQDFPVLRSRIVVLIQHLASKRPRTWKELWRDKRDSANWYTFWAVLVIGGLGVLLGFVQVVLQIAQVSFQFSSH